MTETADTAVHHARKTGDMVAVGLLWVVCLLVGGLFVVDAIGALDTEPDECYAYAYGGGPGGYGCNPLLDDAYFEVDQTTGLVDRQQVHIDGFLFDPNRTFGIVQCSGVSFVLDDTPSGVTACDLSTAVLGTTTADGTLSIDMTVRRIINTPDAGEVDCAQTGADCVIAGGVLGPDGMSTTEAAWAPTSFDPNVPPIPPPTMEIEVVEIDADSATLLVDCANATQVYLEAQLQQEIGGLFGSAYGYLDAYEDEPACALAPTEYEIALESGSRRIGRGDVTYYVWGWASDGYESAYSETQGEFRVRRTPRPTYQESYEPGNELELDVIGVVGRGEGQKIRIAVTCNGPLGEFNSASVQVSQWAGLDRIYAYGNVDLGSCDGRTQVDVPIVAANGKLRGGTAQVDATVYVQSYSPETGYYFDRARQQTKVRLRGSLAAELDEPEERPDSRITIDRVTRDGVTGTVTCDEPVMVDLQFDAQQYQGRVIRSVYAYEGFACDGIVDFDIDWSTRLERGTTTVNAYANAYVLNDPPDYPVVYPEVVPTTTVGGNTIASRGGAVASGDVTAESHVTYVWFDQQGTTVRIRR